MLNPEMVIFNDFSTYRRRPSWKKGLAEPAIITTSHDLGELDYSFGTLETAALPIGDYRDYTIKEKTPYSPELGWKWNLGWKILRPSVILLWPFGPEDVVSPGPVDEILAVGGIFVGGGLMLWDLVD